MDKFVKGVIGLSTLALILDLFDLFNFSGVNIVCYTLLLFCGLYFVLKKREIED